MQPEIRKIKTKDTSELVRNLIKKYCKKSPSHVLFYDEFYAQQFNPLIGDTIKSEYDERYNFMCDVLLYVHVAYDNVEVIEYETADGRKTNIYVDYNNESDDLCILFEYDNINSHVILTELKIL